jgi:hypothetical protein
MRPAYRYCPICFNAADPHGLTPPPLLLSKSVRVTIISNTSGNECAENGARMMELSLRRYILAHGSSTARNCVCADRPILFPDRSRLSTIGCTIAIGDFDLPLCKKTGICRSNQPRGLPILRRCQSTRSSKMAIFTCRRLRIKYPLSLESSLSIMTSKIMYTLFRHGNAPFWNTSPSPHHRKNSSRC